MAILIYIKNVSYSNCLQFISYIWQICQIWINFKKGNVEKSFGRRKCARKHKLFCGSKEVQPKIKL